MDRETIHLPFITPSIMKAANQGTLLTQTYLQYYFYCIMACVFITNHTADSRLLELMLMFHIQMAINAAVYHV